MSAKTLHVLLVYRYADGQLDVLQFDESDEATAAYAAKEAELASQVDQYEVVLVGADSIDTIMKTHGHYFAKAGDSVERSLFSEFLTDAS